MLKPISSLINILINILLLLVTLSVQANSNDNFELKPTIRSEPISKVKYTIKTKEILPFLANTIIFHDQVAIDSLPYTLGYLSGRIIGGVDDEIFVNKLNNNSILNYSFLGEQVPLFHPDTKESLGIQYKIIGLAEIKKLGEPAILKIVQSNLPIEQGTKLIPRESLVLPNIIEASEPNMDVHGYILSVTDGLGEMGRYNVATISLGTRDKMEIGNILDIVQAGRKVPDPLSATRKLVQLPEEKFGEIMIYKTFENVSLGLILNANRPVAVQDIVISKQREIKANN